MKVNQSLKFWLTLLSLFPLTGILLTACGTPEPEVRYVYTDDQNLLAQQVAIGVEPPSLVIDSGEKKGISYVVIQMPSGAECLIFRSYLGDMEYSEPEKKCWTPRELTHQ